MYTFRGQKRKMNMSEDGENIANSPQEVLESETVHASCSTWSGGLLPIATASEISEKSSSILPQQPQCTLQTLFAELKQKQLIGGYLMYLPTVSMATARANIPEKIGYSFKVRIFLKSDVREECLQHCTNLEKTVSIPHTSTTETFLEVQLTRLDPACNMLRLGKSIETACGFPADAIEQVCFQLILFTNKNSITIL